MKNASRPSTSSSRSQLHPFGASSCLLALALAAASPAHAVDVYWDTNGATAGASSGTTANGTWDAATTGNWTTSPTGVLPTSSYFIATGSSPSTADVIFSAGSNVTASSTITINSQGTLTGVTANSLRIKDGSFVSATSGSFTSGPVLTLGGGGFRIDATTTGASSFNSNTSVGLAASQQWNNDSSFLFTAGGPISSAVSAVTTLTFSGTGSGGTTLTGLISNGASGTTAIGVNTAGSGVTTLSNGSNTFSGGTTLTQGILRASQSGATGSVLGTGGLNLAGGELRVVRSSDTRATTLTNAISVTGDVRIVSEVGSGNIGVTHTLGALSAGTQTITVTSGAMVTSGTSGINFGATTLTGTTTFDVINGPSSLTRVTLGALSGGGSLNKNGAGTLNLATAASGFTGDTFINEGILNVTNASALGTGTIYLGAATGNNDAALNVALGNSTINNNIVVTANSGSAVFKIANPSSSANTGVTYGGTVTLNDDVTLVSTAGGGNITFGNAITGPLSGRATITHDGNGTTTFGATSTIGSGIDILQNAGTLSLSGTNTSFTGSVTVNGGQLTTGANGLASGANVISVGASGTFHNAQGTSTPVVIAGLRDGAGGGGAVTMSAANRFISLAGSGTYAFSGSIVTGGLNKTGTGTQILSGSNSYTAATTVSAGTLLVEGSLGNTAVSVTGGTLGGSGSIAGAVSIGNGGTLSPGSSPGTITLASLSMLNGSSLVFEGGDLVNVTGQLDLDDNWTLVLGPGFADGGSVVLFTFGTLAAAPDLVPTINIDNLGFTPSGPLSVTLSGNTVVLNGVSAIPEPSTALLAGVGLTLVLVRARRARRI